MDINTLTSPANVWGAATRTLTSPSGVWQEATRQLTSIAANFTGFQNIGSVVATGTQLDLRPAAGKFRHLHASAPASAASQFQQTDGTTGVNVIAVNTQLQFYSVGNPTIGIRYNNQSGGSVTVTYQGWDEG